MQVAPQLAAENTLMAEDAAESPDRKGRHSFFYEDRYLINPGRRRLPVRGAAAREEAQDQIPASFISHNFEHCFKIADFGQPTAPHPIAFGKDTVVKFQSPAR
jgi:hypothetical protein